MLQHIKPCDTVILMENKDLSSEEIVILLASDDDKEKVAERERSNIYLSTY